MEEDTFLPFPRSHPADDDWWQLPPPVGSIVNLAFRENSTKIYDRSIWTAGYKDCYLAVDACCLVIDVIWQEEIQAIRIGFLLPDGHIHYEINTGFVCYRTVCPSPSRPS